MKKKIYVIYTGGTIGMKKTPHGYAPESGYLKEQMDAMPELTSDLVPSYTFVEYTPLLDSSNMSYKDWNTIATDIASNYESYDGFVVLHGTDTMAYTASALSFMLTGLTKPVIVTGSQIPLCEVRNDARQNLITAFILAGNCGVPEVCVYFGNKLMRGNRTTKVSADAMLAFASPEYPALAKTDVHITVNWNVIKKPESEKFKLTLYKELPVAVLKIFPGIQGEILSEFITNDLKGLVIEAFGAGNIPSGNGSLHRILKTAKENGTAIVVCSQCFRGTVELGAYETSQELIDAGAIGGYDMTLEAAVTKLYYLLSIGANLPEIKQYMQTDLRGELTGGLKRGDWIQA